ncbi:MAG: 3-hydroxybutyrate oligomer hydrolase family protein [Geminicoccaceae bacterium]
MRLGRSTPALAAGLCALGLAANAAAGGYRDVVVTHYPAGSGDDLLTAGLGAAGLQGVAPAVTDATDPAQLRRLAIYNNYRALVDVSAAGGYGSLYGPTVAPPAQAGPDGQIYGWEYLTYAHGGDKVTMMVQIPDFFGQGGRPACIVTGPSSGSRGVYGAIGTSGEWGLKQGCAVAYTDKGTGIGAHDLQNGTVTTLRGVRESVAEAGRDSNFTAKVPRRELKRYLDRLPDRWAWKQAHSQANPEADWDRDVLDSIEFAFWALQDRFGRPFGPKNTLVIASSVSNGGAASLRAAEIARPGLIDGVVVSEPNVNPVYDPRFGIQQGDGPVLHRHSRPLYDYLSVANLYQACANLAEPTAPFNLAPSAARCQSLRDAGLLDAADPADWPAEAQARLNGYGLLPEQNVAAPSYWSFYVPQAVVVTYANAYSRAAVTANLCAYSFAAASAASPTPGVLPATSAAQLFATANGIPPTGGIGAINDLAPGGPRFDPVSTPDQNLDGAVCLRSLWLGGPQADSGRKAPLPYRLRLGVGVAQILASGRLHGTPTIILHGRSDALIAPNHSSRAYYGLNRLRDGNGAPTRYYEVTNAQHLDAFNSLPGYSERFIPLHKYFVDALDLMWAHLTAGDALPPSQVVTTTPRAGGAPITAANVPPIATNPGTEAIGFTGNVVRIPD